MSIVTQLAILLLLNFGLNRAIRNNDMPIFSNFSEYYLYNCEPDSCENEFYPNGMLESVTCYKNGLIDGWARSYYESGILSAEVFFVKNKKIGEAKYYLEDGSVFMFIGYSNDGEIEYLRKVLGDNVMMEFYENGELIKTIFQVTKGVQILYSDTVLHNVRRY